MSHELSPIMGRPDLFLDASLIDGSHFIRSRSEVEATFEPSWEQSLQDPVALSVAEDAMFRSHFESVGGALVCTQCGARLRGRGRRGFRLPREALLHMRANRYRFCPQRAGIPCPAL